MRRWIVPGLVAGLLLAGCDEGFVPEITDIEYGGGDFQLQINVDGRPRIYVVHVPSTARPGEPAPLLVVLHAAGQAPTAMRSLAGMHQFTDPLGWMVAYPVAFNGSWVAGDDPMSPPVDDAQFILEMLDAIAAEVDIDPARVFAAGYSRGGLMAQSLACDLESRFAAVATVAASQSVWISEGCQLDRPVPIALFLGDEDTAFPWEGELGETDIYYSAVAAADWWAEQNGCEGGPTIEPLPDVEDDGTTVERWSHAGCDAGADVVLFGIRGGGHTWPGAATSQNPALGRVSNDIVASREIVEFFEAHPRP